MIRIWFNRPKFDEGKVPPRAPFIVRGDDIRTECFEVRCSGPVTFRFDPELSPSAWAETEGDVTVV